VNLKPVAEFRWLALIAPLVMLLLMFRWFLLRASVSQIAGYIKFLEGRIRLTGWESHLVQARFAHWHRFDYVSWITVVVANFVAAVFVIARP
jgi:hypothetical protein